ncbi:MAG: long-chain fatty acid--CoA ligase, partial [Muribaculaceae bacterium]|nr:long-chain fatty acid--CoA ligase [Muribaculaceae bacterium]
GRSKTMILGPSGQNIYPEEIESILNAMPYVGESLVVSDDGKLVALIYADPENKDYAAMSAEEKEKAMDENIARLNAQMPAYSKIVSRRMMDTEFEKTPKRSIKRYLYQ